MEEIKLSEWIKENIPKDEMIWRKGYQDQISFVQERIPETLCKDYDDYKKIRENILVISEHTSKSIKLPVYKINTKNIELIIRENFYDWKISVNSQVDINTDFMKSFRTDKDINSCYCEGFPKELVYKSYSKNKKQFTIEIVSEYLVYTFLWIISRSIA